MSIGNTTNICTICRNKGETNWYNISNHNQKNNQDINNYSSKMVIYIFKCQTLLKKTYI